MLHYNRRCQPPWEPQEYEELRGKLAYADHTATINGAGSWLPPS